MNQYEAADKQRVMERLADKLPKFSTAFLHALADELERVEDRPDARDGKQASLRLVMAHDDGKVS